MDKAGATYNITANPPGTHNFTGWETEGSLSTGNATSASTTCAVSGGGVLRMVLEPKGPPPYTVTFDTDPENTGTITFDGTGYSDGGTVDKAGATYNITANPPGTHNFTGWEVEGSLSTGNATSANTTCTVSGGGVLRMVLEPKGPPPYTITFDTDPENTGTITFDGTGYSDGGTVDKAGATYNITANPPGTHNFTGWETEGSLTVSDTELASTTVSVSGGGVLRMVLKKKGGGNGGGGDEEEEPDPVPPVILPPPVEKVEYFTVDFLGKITQEPILSDGRLLNALAAPSPDGSHLLLMEPGTRAIGQDGKAIKFIEITEAAETPGLPFNTVLVGNAYEFEPSGINFTKSIRLTLGYDIDQLPENVGSVDLAYYTAESGWVNLEPESGAVAELGKVSAPVQHFTMFAVLASLPPPAAFKLSKLSIEPSSMKILESLTFVEVIGKTAAITVEASNYGGQEGRYSAILKIDGEIWETTEIKLGPGQTQQVAFTVVQDALGSHVIQVGDLGGEFQSFVWINWWLILGFILGFAALGWLITYIVKHLI